MTWWSATSLSEGCGTRYKARKYVCSCPTEANVRSIGVVAVTADANASSAPASSDSMLGTKVTWGAYVVAPWWAASLLIEATSLSRSGLAAGAIQVIRLVMCSHGTPPVTTAHRQNRADSGRSV